MKYLLLSLISSIALGSYFEILPMENGGTNHSSAYGTKSIPFSNGTELTEGAIQYDDGNQTLVIGSPSPQVNSGLDVAKSQNALSGIFTQNMSTGTLALSGMSAGGGSGFTIFTHTGTNYATFPNQAVISNVTGNGIALGAPTSKPIAMYQNGVLKAGVTTGGDFQSETNLIARLALKLEDPGAGTNQITIQAPTLAAPYTLTLPVDDGTTGQVLTTDGSGVLSWATGGSGSPGGATTAVQFNNSGAFDGDATNFAWDNTSKTLLLGNATSVPFSFAVDRTDVDASGQAGGAYVRHNSQDTASSAQLYTGLTGEEWMKVDAGVSNNGGGAGLIGNVYRNQGSVDAGAVQVAVGVVAGTHITSTDPAASTALASVFYGTAEYESGSITDAYDIYFPTGNLGATITNRYGIYISPDNSGVKNNFISGKMAIGQNYTAPTSQLTVTGDIAATNTLANDTGGSAANIQVSSHVTTGTVSATTIGEDLSATGIVDATAENDKQVSGQVLTVTRGNGSDQGILDNLIGSNVLLFNNPDPAGVTQNVVGYQSDYFAQNGVVTNLYNFKAEFVPAGGGSATNYFGYYVSTGSSGACTNCWAFYNADDSLRSSFAGAVDFRTNITLRDPGGSNRWTITSPAMSADYTLTLPVDDGTPGQVLTTDGSGVTSWTTNSVASGNYTPAFTNEANLGGDPSIAAGCYYLQVANRVHIGCNFGVAPTLPATQTTFSVDLPVAPAGNNNAAGACSGAANVLVDCTISQDTSTTVQVKFTSGSGSGNLGVQFDYML